MFQDEYLGCHLVTHIRKQICLENSPRKKENAIHHLDEFPGPVHCAFPQTVVLASVRNQAWARTA